ncbi:MAG: NifB/NifX family molybdenum-iron cluster-binding protein [Syntrophomonadaceae bacterium]|nr:NifB/NifX family molybdenum-iron cluster-binding protein [Syntrophomonadaceae bacterium]
MLIAVATENNKVAEHFGHCDQFTLYNLETGEYSTLANPEHQPGMLPGYLRQNGVDVIIAGGMGERAKLLFNELNIEVYVGIASDIESAVETYKAGRLNSKDVFCQHDDHNHDCNHERG